jgi:hypothetical protein
VNRSLVVDPAPGSLPASPDRYGPGALLIAFACLQFFCQLLLLVQELSPVRVVIRMSAFLGSAALLVVAPGVSTPGSRLRLWAYAILLIVALSAFNPESSNVVASVAQLALYASILGPLFWVARLRVSYATFQRLMLLFWLFYTASAVVGVLQTYFPGSFQPALSTVVSDQGAGYLESLEIELASGARIFRPMGLTDSPGGAAYGGLYAVLLGLGMLQGKSPFRGARVLAVGSVIIGAMCLYLCQVRSLLVMTGICVVTLAFVLVLSGRFSRLLGAGLVICAGAALAFILAQSVGGEAVASRLSTLTSEDPGSVYYKNRGMFLEDAVERLLPLYPLGAGLGRWGMISRYFGDGVDSIWAEIQWTGWLLDGGVPLIIAYTGAILGSTWACLRLALQRDGREGNPWAATIVAYNVGAFALCFNYPLFMGTSGIEFWLLNAALLQSVTYSESTLPQPST